jgi:predicted MFS family arabinose efflux permease
MSRLSTLLPSSRDGRTLSLVTFVHSVGFGSFAACGALFFIRSAGLSVREVGVGTAIAGLIALAAALLAGQLADRVGPRDLLVVLCVAQAVLFASYSAVHSFGFFLVVICALTAADQGAWVARNTVIASMAAGSDRVRLKGHLRSVSKLGVALGTGFAAIPLYLDTRAAYLAVVFCNAGVAVATAFLAARLPRRSRSTATRSGPATHSSKPSWMALRDRQYMSVAVLCGLLATYHSLLTIALPLWVANNTDAPDALVAALFVSNTVLSVGLQTRASRRADTASAARRTARLGARLIAPACALFAMAATVPAGTAVVLLVAGVVVLTVGELWTSAAAWSLSFELADSRAPGQYQGAFAVGMSVDAVAGPLLATGLVLGLGIVGWLAAGLLFLLLGSAVAGASQRALATRPAGAAGDQTVRLAHADLTVRLAHADRTLLLANTDPTVRLAHADRTVLAHADRTLLVAYADPTLRLAYPDAATDLLSAVAPAPGVRNAPLQRVRSTGR